MGVCLHRRKTVRNQVGRRHKTCANATGLHSITRTAAIEIHGLVVEILGEFGAGSQGCGIATAKLQHDRLIGCVLQKSSRFIVE